LDTFRARWRCATAAGGVVRQMQPCRGGGAHLPEVAEGGEGGAEKGLPVAASQGKVVSEGARRQEGGKGESSACFITRAVAEVGRF
jgi:hypothetical protein